VNVIVAHPDAKVREVVRTSLARVDAQMVDAESVAETLAACRAHAPEVALVDLGLARADGFALLHAIKTDPELFQIAVVLVATELPDDAALEALHRGAEDLLRHPAPCAEVVARVRAAARAGALRDQLLERERGLEQLAYSDELTSLYNRRFLGRQLSALIRSATRHARALSIVLVDIDRFKSVNDDHGHEKGDRVLERVASRLAHVLREEDFAGRWGGEEFLILLPDVDEVGAHATAERLRESVSQRPVVGLPVTVSAGCATWQPGESADDLLRRCDHALYEAKRNGRDCVIAAVV
jgi:two-component system cell cycle response regulator